MNIFNELKKYILPYYPIFEYKGQEIYNAIFENWGGPQLHLTITCFLIG